MRPTIYLIPITILLAAASLWIGSTDLSAMPAERAAFIMMQLRLPAMLMAIAAGIALSLSGLTMQTLMGNPLADPSLLGVTAGAALGQAIGLLLHMPALGYAFSALGALAVCLLLMAFSSIVRQRTTLLLFGIMLSFVLSSLVSVFYYLGSAHDIQQFAVWGLGSVMGNSLRASCASLIIAGAGAALLTLLSHPLDSLLLGEAHASSVGHNVRRLRSITLTIVSILTALITTFCGPVVFVGLAVPHAARILCRTSRHATVIPATALLGASVILFCHILCQLPALVFGMGILPLGVVTPLLGAPIVLAVLMRGQNYSRP